MCPALIAQGGKEVLQPPAGREEQDGEVARGDTAWIRRSSWWWAAFSLSQQGTDHTLVLLGLSPLCSACSISAPNWLQSFGDMGGKGQGASPIQLLDAEGRSKGASITPAPLTASDTSKPVGKQKANTSLPKTIIPSCYLVTRLPVSFPTETLQKRYAYSPSALIT